MHRVSYGLLFLGGTPFFQKVAGRDWYRERERAMRKRCLQWIAKDTYDAFMGLVWTGIFTNIYPEKETTVNLAKHTTHGWYAKESVFAYAFLHVSIVD